MAAVCGDATGSSSRYNNFSATSRSSRGSHARYTVPNEPAPICSASFRCPHCAPVSSAPAVVDADADKDDVADVAGVGDAADAFAFPEPDAPEAHGRAAVQARDFRDDLETVAGRVPAQDRRGKRMWG